MTEILTKLQQLQCQLMELGLWENTPPNQAALNSSQPFSLDTLTPTQWLQWVFIPKIRSFLENQQSLAKNQSLPNNFEITPYFEQTLPIEQHLLLPCLRQLDELFNQ